MKLIGIIPSAPLPYSLSQSRALPPIHLLKGEICDSCLIPCTLTPTSNQWIKPITLWQEISVIYLSFSTLTAMYLVQATCKNLQVCNHAYALSSFFFTFYPEWSTNVSLIISLLCVKLFTVFHYYKVNPTFLPWTYKVVSHYGVTHIVALI